MRVDQLSNFEDSYILPNNFDFEHSINAPLIQTSDIKMQNNNSLMHVPNDVKKFERNDTPDKKAQNEQKKPSTKKIVPVMIDPQVTENKYRVKEKQQLYDQQIKKVETSTKTYSFCEKKSKGKPGATVIMPNATRGTKNQAQLSEKMSSIYAAAPGVSPAL